MGDRCTVRIVENGGDPSEGPSMYLHWNGTIEEVYALCVYCRAHRYRCGDDSSYGLGRLVAVAGNFIDPVGGLSMGVLSGYEEEWDNGHYTVADDWRIVDWTKAEKFAMCADDNSEESPWALRPYTRPDGSEGQEYVPTDLRMVRSILVDIDCTMPERARFAMMLPSVVQEVEHHIQWGGEGVA